MSGKRLHMENGEDQLNITKDFINEELPSHQEFWLRYDEDGVSQEIDFSGNPIETSSRVQRMIANKFDVEQADSETIMHEYASKRDWTLGIHVKMKRAKIMNHEWMSAFCDQEDNGDVDPVAIRTSVLSLFRVVEMSRHIINTIVVAKTSQTSLANPIFDSILCHDNQVSRDKMRDHQELILYLLDEISSKGYRRLDNDMYKQIFIGEHATHAWVKVHSIEQFIHITCNKETNYGHWNKLTNKLGVGSSIHEFLCKTADIQFPDLVADRHILSFNNGYLICNHEVNNKLVPVFRRYEEDNLSNLDYDPNEKDYGDIVSAVLHRLDFPSHHTDMDYNAYNMRSTFIDDGCMSIKTPMLDEMLTYQDLDGDMKYWTYVFIGRMLFDSNVYDNWQVMPFLKGVAGSGKSTIAYDVISRFYNPEDVFVISNNCEKKFGLQNCMRADGKRLKYMCIMPEVKHDFGMEQADWQQAVSGERIPINRKHMTTVTETFRLPMFAAGNQMVGYDDNSNSVARRVPVIKFNNPVGGRQDGELPKKLQKELAHIILKCVFAYSDAVNKYGKSQIWEYLPQKFQDERSLLVQSQHPLMNYLGSGKVSIRPFLYIPMKTFTQAFKQHVTECCLSKFQWNSDFYELPFATFNITIHKNQKLEYDGRRVHGTFIRGVDVIDGDSTPVERYFAEHELSTE